MSTIYIDEVQAANILQQMWQECETDPLCDVVLIAGVEEIKIPAHRAILSRATGYFKGMFTSLRESREKEVKIPSVDGHAFKSLIEFFYTGRVEIREDNVEKLLEAADMLLLSNVVAACGKFLTEQLDTANCLGFMFLAEQFHCQSLLEYAKEYCWNNFMDVYKSQEFLKLNNEQLGQLLASDNLRVTSEKEVFNSLLLWLEHDRCERVQYKDNLLKLVRMPLLDPKFLIVHVKPVCMSAESRQLYYEVLEWNSLQDPTVVNLSISIKPRRSPQILIGMKQTNNKMYIHYYCPQRRNWMRWINDLEHRRNFAVATMGHNIYIAGGQGATGNILNTVLCLNLKTTTFNPVYPMTEHRMGCRALVLNGNLYVAGGFNGSTYLNSVEKWDPRANAWNKVASMSVGRSDFGIAELNKKIYVVGGKNACIFGSSGKSCSAEYYCSDQNIWTSIALMSEPRCRHGVAVVNGLLYAVGGDSITVERYDSVTNQWSIISNLPEGLNAYNSCTAFNDKVVACYGDRVDEYDATTNEWKTNQSLKGLPDIYRIFSYSHELLIKEFAEN